ncbi:MAG: ExeM/NucH family extracellular endonuclease [Actinotalea sp.]|nr:ExeM/NucH family extracellular endonuclease [Actinotalea sp.]
MHHPLRRALTSATAVAVCVAPALAVPMAATAAVSPDAPVVINEVYGGGGNGGATYTHDFVELFNKGTEPVDLTGWSIQYWSATGENLGGLTTLSGTIEPGEHYLVQQAQGAGGTTPLPTPDAVGTIAMAATAGSVALVSQDTAVSCAGTACATLPSVVDLVGFGSTASRFVGSGPTVAPSNTASVARRGEAQNTADNRDDFVAGAPTPTASGGGQVTDPDPDPEPDPEPEPEPEVPTVTPLTIEEIQGTGPASPHVGVLTSVRGVVTAAYPTGGFNAFVIQTPGSGGALDPAEHEGSNALYVFRGSRSIPQIGQYVEVVGTVDEFNGLTQVNAAAGDVTVRTEDVEAPKPVTGMPWPATEEGREALESMLFEPFGAYTVTNNFTNAQFSEIGLAYGDSPLVQPTDIALPRSAEYDAALADNEARRVVLDDGASTNFGATNRNATPPYLTLENPVRVGAEVFFPDAVIVDYRFNLWRFQPRSAVTSATPLDERPTFEDTRTDAPDAERLGDGELRVAAFNVLNYFTTLGEDTSSCTAFTDKDGNPITVRGGCDQRGAFRTEDFERQEGKIVAAINALDADVVGLMEIENSLRVSGVDDEALARLVTALNEDAGAGTWAYVPSSAELPPVAEMDVISNAIIYRPAAVDLLGEMRVLGDLSGSGEPFSNAREPLGQAFVPVGGGEPFFVVVNHFKSKGSGSGDNADQGDGQGASNLDRVRQATALRDWVPTVLDDYEVPVQDVFLVGDFNSYTQEDPLQVLYAAGYVNANEVMAELGFDREYSYSFSGLSGSLDHVLMSTSVLDRFTGADIWEINSPEPVQFEYSRYNYYSTLLFEEGPFRSSDHDPVIVAFGTGADGGPSDPVGPPPPHAGTKGVPPFAGEQGPPPHAKASGTARVRGGLVAI